MEIGRSLRPGDIIRSIPNGEPCVIKYVNQSGAYAVPLTGLQREIKGKQVEFQAPGRTISADSLVELMGCMEVEENVKMKQKGKGTKGGGGNVASKSTKRKPKSEGEGDSHQLLEEVKAEVAEELAETDTDKIATADDVVRGVPLSSFAYDPKQTGEAGTGGHPVAASADTSASSEAQTEMAKTPVKAKVKAKSNGHANGAAKRERTPKQVRKCTCGCGTETSGYFAPGHDAKFHGWIKKLADGRIEPKDVPAAVRNGLSLVQTKNGYQAKTPHYFKD